VSEAVEKPWVANKPEDRLKIATFRFLKRSLVPPFYVASVHDSDGGGRSDLQRIRDANKGIVSGQLDMDVVQGPPALARKLELKRGRNTTSDKQDKTIEDLTACGAPPVVAWTLRQAFAGLLGAGFTFLPNVLTTLAHMEEELAGWDRAAELILAGKVTRKVSARKPTVKTSSVAWARRNGVWRP
jgi:hypothetical protein